jgi:hypothetical protein
MNNAQKEELRRLVLAWLAQRASLAFNATSVRLGVSREMPCTIPEIEEAMLFLFSLRLLDEVRNSLGAVRYFQINAAGTLSYERGE